MSEDVDRAAVMVEVLWRPGCPYCATLRHDLARRGIAATWRNIWTDDAARTAVRAANAGNETVPTVRIGQQTYTNPNGAAVAQLLGLPDPPSKTPLLTGFAARTRPQRTAARLLIALLILTSVLVDVTGHAALSWAMDAVTLGAWWVTRPARR